MRNHLEIGRIWARDFSWALHGKNGLNQLINRFLHGYFAMSSEREKFYTVGSPQRRLFSFYRGGRLRWA